MLGRGEKKGWAPIQYSPRHSKLRGHQLSESCASQCIPPPHPYARSRPGAACHLGGLASRIAGSLQPQGLYLPWPACPLEGLPPHGAAPKTAPPPEKACIPEKLEKAWPGCKKNLPTFSGSPFKSGCPREESLGFTAAQLAAPALGGCCTPAEQLPSTASPLQEPSQPRKARTSLARP